MIDSVHLILKHEFYDAIDQGQKDTEYRDNTSYWRRRILGKHPSGKGMKEFVTFHRGYTRQTMTFEIAYLVVPKLAQIEIHLGKRIEN